MSSLWSFGIVAMAVGLLVFVATRWGGSKVKKQVAEDNLDESNRIQEAGSDAEKTISALSLDELRKWLRDRNITRD